MTARTGNVPAAEFNASQAAINELCVLLKTQNMQLARLTAWREVAVALAAELADSEGGADPTCTAVLAYNHARNGRMAEALEVLE